MSVMRDDMTLGAWRDSGSSLNGRWKVVLADGSCKAEEVKEVIVWLRALRSESTLRKEKPRTLDAKRQGVMRRNVGQRKSCVEMRTEEAGWTLYD